MPSQEHAIIVKWIIENVTEEDIPLNGSTDALIWNLVHLATQGRPYDRYNYSTAQKEIVGIWRKG